MFSVLFLSTSSLTTHTKLDQGRSIYTLLRERERGRLTASLQRRTNEKEMPIANHRVLFYTTHFIHICTQWQWSECVAHVSLFLLRLLHLVFFFDRLSVLNYNLIVKVYAEQFGMHSIQVSTRPIWQRLNAYMQRGQVNTCLYSVFFFFGFFFNFCYRFVHIFRDSEHSTSICKNTALHMSFLFLSNWKERKLLKLTHTQIVLI